MRSERLVPSSKHVAVLMIEERIEVGPAKGGWPGNARASEIATREQSQRGARWLLQPESAAHDSCTVFVVGDAVIGVQPRAKHRVLGAAIESADAARRVRRVVSAGVDGD